MRSTIFRLATMILLAWLVAGCAPAATTGSLATSPSPSTAVDAGASPSGHATPAAPTASAPLPTPTPEPSRDATAASWHAVGNMVTPHAYHTATLLPDGRVLVAGGLVNDRLDGRGSASAELFDPGSASWTATTAMARARWGHTATLLLDGTVLVAGGYLSGGVLRATAELYDAKTGRWTATGSMNRGRGGQTATLLPDGRVLVVGGGAESTELEGGPRSATA